MSGLPSSRLAARPERPARPCGPRQKGPKASTLISSASEASAPLQKFVVHQDDRCALALRQGIKGGPHGVSGLTTVNRPVRVVASVDQDDVVRIYGGAAFAKMVQRLVASDPVQPGRNLCLRGLRTGPSARRRESCPARYPRPARSRRPAAGRNPEAGRRGGSPEPERRRRPHRRSEPGVGRPDPLSQTVQDGAFIPSVPASALMVG